MDGESIKIVLERLGYNIKTGRDVLLMLGYSSKTATRMIGFAVEKMGNSIKPVFSNYRYCYKNEEEREELLVLFGAIRDYIVGLENYYDETKDCPYPDRYSLPLYWDHHRFFPRSAMSRELREFINNIIV